MMPSKVLKHSDIDTDSYNNRYVMLLQRLDEEEGICEPSIEEKLKLAVSNCRGCKRWLTGKILQRLL